MRNGTAQKYLDRLNEWFGFQTESGEVLYKDEVTTNRLAQILRCEQSSLSTWAKQGVLVETRWLGPSRVYVLGDVLRQLECAALGQPNPLRPEALPETDPPASQVVGPPQQPAGPVEAVTPTQVLPPMPLQAMRDRIVEKVPAPLAPAPSDPFQAVQARAAQAAREAYRDVILEAADAAEERGDKDLQIRLLKDFIFAEETLTVYVGKEAR